MQGQKPSPFSPRLVPDVVRPEVPNRTDRGGRRVVARPLSLADARDHFEAVAESSAELRPFMPWCTPGYSLSDSEEWVRNCESKWNERIQFDFGIRELAGDRFLGTASINEINTEHRVGNLGYWIRSGATGNGFASEASRLVAAFGLSEVGLNRVEIVVSVQNLASQRVAEKIGAVREGVQRNRLYLHGRTVDAIMYSITEPTL